MCFIALLYQQVPAYPVMLGANRDERVDRPGLPPQPLRPGVWGGRDPRRGGTWLAVNAHGGIAAVANRHVEAHQAQPADARSRGLLCLDVAAQPGPRAMHQTLTRALNEAPYQPFNLLFGDGAMMYGASWDGRTLAASRLEAGMHVVGNHRLDDVGEPKVARGLALLRPRPTAQAALEMLATACRDHGSRADRRDAICVHSGPSPTLSCTLLAIHADHPRQSHYRHANGRPCETPLHDYASLLRG